MNGIKSSGRYNWRARSLLSTLLVSTVLGVVTASSQPGLEVPIPGEAFAQGVQPSLPAPVAPNPSAPSGADSSVTADMPVNRSGFPTVSYDESVPPEVVAALQKGGCVVLLRHALTDYRTVDSGVLGDRAGQRTLSAEGQEQARQLGRAWQLLDVPVGVVLASPVFRASDTAALAFGPERARVSELLTADDYADARYGGWVDIVRAWLSTPVEEGNLVLVGHRTPFERYTGLAFPDSVLPEGGMAVLRPDGLGGFAFIGTLTAEELAAEAERRY